VFAKIKDGVVEKFPYSIRELFRDHPNTSFPARPSDATLAAFDVVRVTEKPLPGFDEQESFLVQGATPFKEGDQWFTQPATHRFSAEQLVDRNAAQTLSVYAERDRLLLETDWVIVKSIETNVPVPAKWLSYRRALRDISLQEGFPCSVTWPVKP